MKLERVRRKSTKGGEDHKVIDRIIHHLRLTFDAERPPPTQVLQHELLMAAEKRGEYF